MPSPESKTFRRFVRLTCAGSVIALIGGCGILDNKPEQVPCGDDQKKAIVATEAFPSFDKTRIAELQCNAGVVHLVVTDSASGKPVLEEVTRYVSKDGMKIYWSQDGKRLWIANPSQSSLFDTYDLPQVSAGE